VSQTEWLVRSGTVSFLVWANSAEAAERRVRVDNLDRTTTADQLAALPVRRHGPMTVRPATDDDRHIFTTRGAIAVT
jgi:hypothetical protein